jgi:hypothetical protein
MLGGMRDMVAVRFGQACVVRGLVGGGDQNTPYRFKNALYHHKSHRVDATGCNCHIIIGVDRTWILIVSGTEKIGALKS